MINKQGARKVKKSISIKTSKREGICPLVREPYDDCYVMKMTSRAIEPLIYYCSGNFKKCEIFKNHVKGTYKKK